MNKYAFSLILSGAGVLGASAYLTGGDDAAEVIAADPGDLDCPASSVPLTHDSVSLQSFAQTNAAGIVYDNTSSSLQLTKEAGEFRATNFSVNSKVVAICAGDFDGDGWVDFVGGSDGGRDVAFYKNITYENQVAPNIPDWNDPNYRTTPKFATPYYMEHECLGENGHAAPTVCTAGGGGVTISCADFNNDGNLDFFYARSKEIGGNVSISPTNRADIFLGRGDGTFDNRYQAIASLSSLDYLSWSTDSTPYDYNGDSFQDLIVGHSLSDTSSAVHVFLSDGNAAAPKLVRSTALVSGTALGKRGALASTFKDMNQDGLPDLVLSGPTDKDVWIYDGLSGGGVSTTRRNITDSFRGGATTIVSADFSQDGIPDILVASDNWNYNYNNIGGFSAYWKNNGGATPFSDGITQETTTRNNPYYDFDVGVVLDYDHDPDNTPDVIIADGNHAAGYVVLANRSVDKYATCGDIFSGVLELGTLAGVEMVVTGAKMTPTMIVPAGTSVKFYMSNEDPAAWHEASVCVDDSSSYCVSFPKPVGRSVRWKAELCSNSFQTLTPSISSVGIGFDYTLSKEHYRAGVVIDDGVAYVGAFQQPGSRGHFYATNAGLSETYWDFGTTLDAMSDAQRNIYTADTTGKVRIDFTESNAGSASLQSTLGVVSTAQAEAIVQWQRSARFGVDSTAKLGSVETSTPAVVGAPAKPRWYYEADEPTQQRIDAFISDHKDRKKIVLFGSKDGAIHAVRNDPTNITSPDNGKESWAFIPARIAVGMLADYTNGTATSYPDGSPTVADVIFPDDTIHTVAIISGGNGSRGITALDITETLDDTTGAIIGPTPLWHITPGGASAGQATSKPVIARVLVAGVQRFYAIMATGIASENPNAPFTKGRDLVAVDISTGDIVWQFQSECAVTSDISIFETDDVAEFGSPVIDGYTDRAVWADACGNLYKVDPAQDIGTSYLSSSNTYTISTGHLDPDGNDVKSVFATDVSACALGEDRAVYGTIGVRSDSSGRVALMFGTGGSEDVDPTLPNAFYTIYADNGEVRGCAGGTPEEGRILGDCTAGVCEKFYGGVVVTTKQILVTRSTDPPVGTGTCEFGQSKIAGLDLNTLSEEFTVPTSSATTSSLYGDGGSIYFATLAGDLVRIGDPRAANAGEDSISGGTDGDVQVGTPGDGMRMLGWRELQ